MPPETAPLDELVTLSPHVSAQSIDGGAILMNTSSGDCFELNAVGAMVWDLIGRGMALEAIVNEVVRAYVVDEATARADVWNLVQDLARQGIVRVTRR